MNKIGLFGIGLDTYWGQFDGLLDRLKGYQQTIKSKIENMGAEVIDAGLVDNPLKAEVVIVDEASMVDLAASREVVEITLGLEIADQVAIPRGSPCNINTTAGVLPRYDTDNLGRFAALFTAQPDMESLEVLLQG